MSYRKPAQGIEIRNESGSKGKKRECDESSYDKGTSEPNKKRKGTDDAIDGILVLSCERRIRLPAPHSEDLIHASFSKAKYADIAKYFNLNVSATIESQAGFTNLKVKRFRLPNTVFQDVVSGIDMKFMEYGWPGQYYINEASQNHCLSTIFTRILSPWKGQFCNLSEILMPSDISTRGGKVEHRWKVFNSICAIFVEKKAKDSDGVSRLDALAQIILEANGCSIENEAIGHCVPIIALCPLARDLKILVYHPHTRKIYISDDFPNLSRKKDHFALLHSIRSLAENFMTVILCSYINALHAFLTRSEERSEGTRRPSTSKWEEALNLAKQALCLGQDAHEHIQNKSIAEYEEYGNFTDTAESMAENAYAKVIASIASVPGDPTDRPHLIEFLTDENWRKLLVDEMVIGRSI